MTPEEEDTIFNLRAIIISSKGGIHLSEIDKDYREAFGTNIPLKEMGYKHIRNFFERHPNEFRLSGDRVEAVQKQSSGHIASLVSRQKDKHKSGKNSRNIKKQRRPASQDVRNPYTPSSYGYSERRKESLPKSKYKQQVPYESRAARKKQVDVKLRKPYDSWKQKKSTPSAMSRSGHNILKNSDIDPRMITKTVVNDRFVEPGSSPPRHRQTDFSDPFRRGFHDTRAPTAHNVMPLAESPPRLAAEMAFGTDFINRLLRALPSASSSDAVPPRSQASAGRAASRSASGNQYPHQRAQARLANIHMLARSNLMQNEGIDNIGNPDMRNNTRDSASGYSNIATPNRDSASGYSNIATPNRDSASGYSNIATSNLRSSGRREGDPTTSSRSSERSTVRRGSARQQAHMARDDPVGGGLLNSRRRNLGNSNDGEYARKLSQFCMSNGLEQPIYKLLVREPKNEAKQYICKVQIGDNLKYSSYPRETDNAESAKEIVARKAYDSLKAEIESQESYVASTRDLVPRVLEILSSSYGIWSDKLPLLYKERYKEDIVRDWLNFISNTPFFEMDNVDGTRFIIRRRTDPSIDPEIERGFNMVETNEDISIQRLKELVLPDSEFWEVYITTTINSSEIWCRLIGDDYSDAYDAMMTKLELEPLQHKVIDPKIGDIYGVKVSAIWYRVKLVELLSDKQGSIFYIDVGDKDVVDLSDLYYPEDACFSVPPQAIVISLVELESFWDDDDLSALLSTNLLGNTYIAEVIPPENAEQLSDHHTVRLWDTSTDADIDVNQSLLNNIIKGIGLPSLPGTLQIKEVTVSSVNDNAEIHVQTNKKSVENLQRMIVNKIKSQEGNPCLADVNETLGTDILYIARCKKNNILCRAKVIYILNSAYVDVLFIDYGHVERIAVPELISLEKSSVIQVIPPQSVRVKLANVTNFNDKIASKLRELVLDQNVLLKVVKSGRGGLPLVELFKRSKAGGILYLVNSRLTNEPDIRDSDGDPRRKSVVVGLEKVLPQDLPAPNIPDIGEHFEVFVTLASSPDLFIVQPLSSRAQLVDMMNELQMICDGPRAAHLRSDEFVIGALYAVKHPDGNWYRACAQAVIGSCTFSVYLCDFGDCVMVTIDKLMHLPAKYKSFPYQALRASLFGIPREQRDWTPIDIVTFHNLVVEKYFVSTVMEINRDAKNPNYICLGLVLTDTSSDEDIYIHKVLLDNRNEACGFIKSVDDS